MYISFLTILSNTSPPPSPVLMVREKKKKSRVENVVSPGCLFAYYTYPLLLHIYPPPPFFFTLSWSAKNVPRTYHPLTALTSRPRTFYFSPPPLFFCASGPLTCFFVVVVVCCCCCCCCLGF